MEPTPLPAAYASARRADASEVAAEIYWPQLAKGEGVRVLVLGNTRKGKSTFLNWTNAQIKPYLAGVLIHDQKYPIPQYRHDSLRAHPSEIDLAADDGKIIEIFSRPQIATPNDLAKFAKEWSLGGQPFCIEIDELRNALAGNRFIGGEDSDLAWLLTQGGGMGASFIATTQIPNATPTTLRQCCDNYVIFNCDSTVLDYLKDDCSLSREAIAVAPALQPGEFILNVRGGGPWNGTIYQCPAEWVVERPT